MLTECQCLQNSTLVCGIATVTKAYWLMQGGIELRK